MKAIESILRSEPHRHNPVRSSGPAVLGKSNWQTPVTVVCTLAILSVGNPTRIRAGEMLANHGPVKVQILETNGGYQLYVDHRPFYIKGAGIEFGSQEKLKEHGGNSFRTWSTDNGRDSGQEILERARRNGLYVTMGLDLGHERHGFDYNDTNAVARQFASVKAQVMRYKDSPALIIWAIGNELNMDGDNPRVWDAVNDISRMIHQIDPNHPTTTPLAGFKKDLVQEVKSRASDLDFLSFQMYGDIVNLPRYLRASGWTGPYMVTEWGATGHWEVSRTEWGAPIEDDSTTKADFYRKRFEKAIQADPKDCLGSYVFLWGSKQERTPTWYGMFLDSGEETAAVDTMQYLWTGSWPAVRSPEIEGIWLNGKTAHQNVHLKPGEAYPARVQASDYNHNSLTYKWEVMEECTDLKTGGDHERTPESLPGLVRTAEDGKIVLQAPSRPGAYRLFTYIFDGKGHAAHANIPFYVDPPAVNSAETANQ